LAILDPKKIAKGGEPFRDPGKPNTEVRLENLGQQSRMSEIRVLGFNKGELGENEKRGRVWEQTRNLGEGVRWGQTGADRIAG